MKFVFEVVKIEEGKIDELRGAMLAFELRVNQLLPEARVHLKEELD